MPPKIIQKKKKVTTLITPKSVTKEDWNALVTLNTDPKIGSILTLIKPVASAEPSARTLVTSSTGVTDLKNTLLFLKGGVDNININDLKKEGLINAIMVETRKHTSFDCPTCGKVVSPTVPFLAPRGVPAL